MTAEEFLQTGRTVAMSIKAEQSFIHTIQDEICSMSALRGAVPKYSTKEWHIDEALRIAYRLIDGAKANIRDLRQQTQEVEAAILAVPDHTAQTVLYGYFIQGKDWPQIADEMYYSTKTIFRYRKTGLALVEVPEKYRNA